MSSKDHKVQGQKAAYFDFDFFWEGVESFSERTETSLREIARQANVHYATMYHFRSGKKYPGIASLVAIAHICDLRLDDYVMSNSGHMA